MHKKYLAFFCILLLSSYSQAQNISAALNQCRAEKNNSQRLACFDALVEDISQDDNSQAPVLSSKAVITPQKPNKTVPPIPQQKPSISAPIAARPSVNEFGLEHKKEIENSEDKIYARVSSVKKDPYKKLIITLDNGQRWKQSDSTFLKLKLNDAVYVERGALKSFFMGMDDKNRRMRVKRIK